MDNKGITETIIAIEIAALEKWNRGNPTGFLEILADDVTYFDPFTEKRFDGFEKMNEFYESLRGKGWVDKYEIINPMVQSTAGMAVLTYNLDSYARDILYKWNCTEVYKLMPDKKWKIIHNHWSFVQPLKSIKEQKQNQ